MGPILINPQIWVCLSIPPGKLNKTSCFLWWRFPVVKLERFPLTRLSASIRNLTASSISREVIDSLPTRQTWCLNRCDFKETYYKFIQHQYYGSTCTWCYWPSLVSRRSAARDTTFLELPMPPCWTPQYWLLQPSSNYFINPKRKLRTLSNLRRTLQYYRFVIIIITVLRFHPFLHTSHVSCH